MKIAILGTGAVGTRLGGQLSEAGHEVRYGSRKPGTAQGIFSYEKAAREAKVIITALHGQHVIPVLESIENQLDGKVILDLSNAFTEDFALAYPGDSIGRQIQERFPQALVVKALNTVNVEVMVNPAFTGEETSAFISGNSTAAKQTVLQLMADLGWEKNQVIDLGGIETAIASEHYGLLFLSIMGAIGTPIFNVKVVH